MVDYNLLKVAGILQKILNAGIKELADSAKLANSFLNSYHSTTKIEHFELK